MFFFLGWGRHPSFLQEKIIVQTIAFKIKKFDDPMYSSYKEELLYSLLHLREWSKNIFFLQKNDRTAYCIWSVISSVSKLNESSISLGLCFQVPLNGDQYSIIRALKTLRRAFMHSKEPKIHYTVSRFRWMETNENEIGDWDWTTLQCSRLK